MSKRLIILVYILITALVVGGGVYIYQSGRVEAQKEKIESLKIAAESYGKK